jgi:hypothetical protein
MLQNEVRESPKKSVKRRNLDVEVLVGPGCGNSMVGVAAQAGGVVFE